MSTYLFISGAIAWKIFSLPWVVWVRLARAMQAGSDRSWSGLDMMPSIMFMMLTSSVRRRGAIFSSADRFMRARLASVATDFCSWFRRLQRFFTMDGVPASNCLPSAVPESPVTLPKWSENIDNQLQPAMQSVLNWNNSKKAEMTYPTCFEVQEMPRRVLVGLKNWLVLEYLPWFLNFSTISRIYDNTTWADEQFLKKTDSSRRNYVRQLVQQSLFFTVRWH